MPPGFQQYYDAQGFSVGPTPYHPAVHHASATSAALPSGFLYDLAQAQWYNAPPGYAPTAAPPPSTEPLSLTILPAFAAILEKLSAQIDASALTASVQQKRIDELQTKMEDQK